MQFNGSIVARYCDALDLCFVCYSSVVVKCARNLYKMKLKAGVSAELGLAGSFLRGCLTSKFKKSV